MLFPDVLRLLDDIFSYSEHCLTVLHHQGTLMLLLVNWVEQNDLRWQSFENERLNCLSFLLARRVAN